MNPYVDAVTPLTTDHRILITFENGEQRLFDLSPYLDRGIFAQLKTREAFLGAKVVAGSVEWPGGLDLSYDTLYLESVPYKSKSIE